MPAAPANPFLNTVQQAARFVVLYAKPQQASSYQDETVNLIMTRIVRSAGGGYLDFCELDFKLEQLNLRIVDLNASIDYNRRIEIRLPDDTGNIDSVLLFWGMLAEHVAAVNKRGETARMTARIEPWHFGAPLRGIACNKPSGIAPQQDVDIRLVNLPITFNPEIDGIIEPNAVNAGSTQLPAYIWMDPESVRSTHAIDNVQSFAVSGTGVVSARPVLWTLGAAVDALCRYANPTETWIKNPILTELDDGQGGGIMAGAPPLRNVRLPHGRYLPELLDQLLSPRGYHWYVEPLLLPDTEDQGQFKAAPTLKFFRSGVGPEKEVYFQRPGSVLDLSQSNVTDFERITNIADIGNKITGEGSFKEREVTIELRPGWDASKDYLDAFDLKRSDPESEYQFYPNVWRKFVANEGGDYPPLNDGDPNYLDLSPVLGEDTIPKRRKPYDPLTYRDDGEREPSPVLEWLNPYPDEGDEPQWTRFKGGFQVLEHEIGVWFDGDEPPAELMDLVGTGNPIRVRITCTIRGDTRLTATADRQATSPNFNDIEVVIDLSERFHDRLVQAEGDFRSQLYTAEYGADEVQDQAAIAAYVADVRNILEPAKITANLRLFGIQTGYKLGDLITRINGRNIDLNRRGQFSQAPLYPQVVEITHNRSPQETILKIETFDEERRSRVLA